MIPDQQTDLIMERLSDITYKLYVRQFNSITVPNERT
jgi:hypothetical protein